MTDAAGASSKALLRTCIAFDSFKDSVGARELGEAVASHLAVQFGPALAFDVLALSDGGEGLLAAASTALALRPVSCEVTGPLGAPVKADYALGADGVALIESAQASGIELVPPAQRNPWWTTSFGTGQLLQDAYTRGARRLLVGVGGSATNDGGLGALQALGLQIQFADATATHPCGSTAVRGCDLQRVLALAFPPELEQQQSAAGQQSECRTLLPGATVEVLADVTTRFAGPDGATFTYGPQKGADPAMCMALDVEMQRIAGMLEGLSGVAVGELRGAGAAGGMGGAFAAGLRAQVKRGIEFLAECVGLEERIRSSDLVITGEGRLDGQTLQGKAVSLVIELARRHAVPVVLLCGSSKLQPGLPDLPSVYTLTSLFPMEQCIAEPLPCVRALLDKYAAKFPVLCDL